NGGWKASKVKELASAEAAGNSTRLWVSAERTFLSVSRKGSHHMFTNGSGGQGEEGNQSGHCNGNEKSKEQTDTGLVVEKPELHQQQSTTDTSENETENKQTNEKRRSGRQSIKAELLGIVSPGSSQLFSGDSETGWVSSSPTAGLAASRIRKNSEFRSRW